MHASRGDLKVKSLVNAGLNQTCHCRLQQAAWQGERSDPSANLDRVPMMVALELLAVHEQDACWKAAAGYACVCLYGRLRTMMQAS